METATAERCHQWPDTGINKEGILPWGLQGSEALQAPTSPAVRALSPLVCGQLLQQPQGNQ